ncbi:MAG TPA: FeoC-like transcriptional regulator [Leptolinea sp.]
MLLELLRAINAHPFASFEQLSQAMNIPESIVQNMVADLSKRGYLKSIENCGSGCDNCSESTSCQGLIHARLWMLTEKGREAATKSKA